MQGDITVSDYAEKWLRVVESTTREATFDAYWRRLRLHILPRLGNVALRKLSRAQVRAFMADTVQTGATRETVLSRLTVLSSMLTSAVDDGLIEHNPAARLNLRLPRPTPRLAFTREQLRVFLEKADEVNGSHLSSLWWVLARSGLRIGEAIALQPDDVDLTRRTLRVRHTARKSKIRPLGPTKTGEERTVQIGGVLVDRLTWLLAERLEGRPCFTPWLFALDGARLDQTYANRAFCRVRDLLALPKALVPHSMRHSYASFLVADGAPLEFIRRQLGHRKITTTVNLYGSHAPMEGDNYLARLDD